jgi:hypothetical protein
MSNTILFPGDYIRFNIYNDFSGLQKAYHHGSGAMIYIPSFTENGSVIQKLIRGDSQTQTHRGHGDSISPL